MKMRASFRHCAPARRSCERSAAIHGPAPDAMDRHGLQPRDDEKAVIASHGLQPRDDEKAVIAGHDPQSMAPAPTYRDFRPGDVRHSLADISKAQRR